MAGRTDRVVDERMMLCMKSVVGLQDGVAMLCRFHFWRHLWGIGIGAGRGEELWRLLTDHGLPAEVLRLGDCAAKNCNYCVHMKLPM